MAGILDIIVLGLYVIIANITLSRLFSIEMLEGFNVFTIFILAIPITFYLPVSEYLWNGKTVGKYFLKLRVMRKDGSGASFGDILLRWLLRPIDIKLGFLFFLFVPRSASSIEEGYLIGLVGFFMIFPMPIVGMLSIILSKNKQRVGDLIANTVVIRSSRTISLQDTILRNTKEDYKPTFLNVLELSDRDIYIIKNVLEGMGNSKSSKSVNDLAAKAREILNIELKMPPEQLLRTLLKDYNYLAKKKDEV